MYTGVCGRCEEVIVRNNGAKGFLKAAMWYVILGVVVVDGVQVETLLPHFSSASKNRVLASVV